MTPQLRAWIEAQKPSLVQAAEEYLNEAKIYLPKGGGGKGGKGGRGGGKRKDPRVSGSQLRNLLNVAQTERSVAVFRNFLRYQVGRGSRGWPDPASGEALESYVDRAIGKRSRSAAGQHGVDARELEAELLPLLLGYVIREFTYRCAQNGTSAHG
ncbi:MAG: hypothetical protein ACOC7L_00650 [Acidobacteriota bacterium]